MEYEVKYLNQDGIGMGDLKINIDQPIHSEYENIEKERSRIENTYGQG